MELEAGMKITIDTEWLMDWNYRPGDFILGTTWVVVFNEHKGKSEIAYLEELTSDTPEAVGHMMARDDFAYNPGMGDTGYIMKVVSLWPYLQLEVMKPLYSF